jgi:uncharacterized protein YkwD
VLTVAATVVALAGVVTDVRPAEALTNCAVADSSIDAEEMAFLTLVNNYRAQNGRAALTLSTNLNRASHWLASDMATGRYFSHTDSLGRLPSQRAQDCGYPQGAGENIAAGAVWDTASEAFTAWRNSSGHNANMLHTSYQQIGIARVYTAGSPYGWYWVTDFGMTNDGTNGGSTSDGSSGSATAAPSPTPTQAAVASAAGWNAASGALQYFVYVGTSKGSNSIYGGSTGTETAATVSGLPTNGSTLHVRLWTRFGGGWQYRDYTYTAGQSQVVSQKASVVSPQPGSTLPGSRVTFQWSAGSEALEYFFYLGTSAGANNLFGRSMGLSTGLTLSGVPEDGRLLYVRLWTRLSTGWQYTDATFRAAP